MHTVGNGTDAITVDADPNTSAPAQNRIFHWLGGSGMNLWLEGDDGANLNIQVWVRSAPEFGSSLWFKVDAGVNAQAGNVTLAPTHLPTGQSMTIQITGVSGTVTKLGIQETP